MNLDELIADNKSSIRYFRKNMKEFVNLLATVKNPIEKFEQIDFDNVEFARLCGVAIALEHFKDDCDNIIRQVERLRRSFAALQAEKEVLDAIKEA